MRFLLTGKCLLLLPLPPTVHLNGPSHKTFSDFVIFFSQTARDLGEFWDDSAASAGSSGVLGRGASTPLYDLLDHLQKRNDPVSRGLANLRDGDLRLLSSLTRRAIESLDQASGL